MEKIIEKMDSYNIFNYLLPGAIFDYMFEILFHMKLVQGNIVKNLFVYYFLGMISFFDIFYLKDRICPFDLL